MKKRKGVAKLFREIKKKKLILENRKPYTSEIAAYIDEMNLVDWIYTCMRLDGSDLGRGSVQRVLKGEFIIDIPLSEHGNVDNYHDAIKLAYDMADMGIELNEKYLFRLYQQLAKPERLEYRRTNPVLFTWGYNPPHPSEIDGRMADLFRWMHQEDCQGNPLLRAVSLHHKLMEIYPFETATETMARMAMYYELIYNGYPPVLLDLSEQEYHDALREYLKNENIQPVYDAIEKGVYSKLEVIMQLTVPS